MEEEYEYCDYTEAERLLTIFIYYYCLYKLSLKTEYKDFRRCPRYNYIEHMVTAIDSIIDENDNLKELLLQRCKDYDADIAVQIAHRILWGICGALDLGTWEVREKEDGTKYLYEDIVEYVVKDIDIEKMLTSEYVDYLFELRANDEREKVKFEIEHKEEQYGFIR